MFRILKKDRKVVFSEPWCAHSQNSLALKEVDEFGVLEKDVVLSHISEEALKSGFKELYLKPCPPHLELIIGISIGRGSQTKHLVL